MQDQAPNCCILLWTLSCMLVVSWPYYGWNSLQPRCKYHRLKSSHVYNSLITLLFYYLYNIHRVPNVLLKNIKTKLLHRELTTSASKGKWNKGTQNRATKHASSTGCISDAALLIFCWFVSRSDLITRTWSTGSWHRNRRWCKYSLPYRGSRAKNQAARYIVITFHKVNVIQRSKNAKCLEDCLSYISVPK